MIRIPVMPAFSGGAVRDKISPVGELFLPASGPETIPLKSDFVCPQISPSARE
jgi:hypothetical protein